MRNEKSWKRVLSLIMAIAIVISFVPPVAVNAAEDKTIYLNAGGSNLWDQEDAWFDAWVWGSAQGDKWYTFSAKDENGLYSISVPSDMTGMKIYRRGPGHTGRDFDGNQWNNTGDVVILNDKNLITITGWENGNYSWSAYEAPAAMAVTIHFQNTEGWASVNGYAWSANNSAKIYTDGWPGTATVKNANSGWHTMTLTNVRSTNLGVIFNNGSGSQTRDIFITNAVDGGEYWYTSGGLSPKPDGWNVFDIKVEAENGTVTAPATAQQDENVTLSVAPDDGFVLTSLTVKQGEKKLTLTKNDDGTYTFTMPGGDVTVSATFVACDHATTKAEPNGNGTHNIICTNSTCNGYVVTANVPCDYTTGGTCVCGVTCNHSGNTAQPVDSSNGKHSFTCTVCDGTGTEDCTFGDTDTCICGAKAKAKVVSGETNTYYATLEKALAAGGNVYPLADYAGDFTIPRRTSFYGEGYTFAGTVTNWGYIQSGTFTGDVTHSGHGIEGGTFEGTVTAHAIITGGIFNGAVTTNTTIDGGTFYNTVLLLDDDASYITGGTFNDTVTNNGTITGGTFNDAVTNNGTINNTIVPTTFTLGDAFVLTGEGKVTCTSHIWKDGACRLCGHVCDHSTSEHTTGTDKGDGTHSFICSVCSSTDSENHTFNPTTGNCGGCGILMAAAKTETGGTTTYFPTLQGAIDAAEALSGSTVTVLDDVTLTQGLTVDSGTFTLDMNGKTVSAAADTLIVNGGNVTIKTSVAGGTLSMTGNKDYALQINRGAVTLENGTISSNYIGICVDGGSFTMKSGEVTSQKTGIITVSNATAVILSGKVRSEESTGVNNNGGKVTLGDASGGPTIEAPNGTGIRVNSPVHLYNAHITAKKYGIDFISTSTVLNLYGIAAIESGTADMCMSYGIIYIHEDLGNAEYSVTRNKAGTIALAVNPVAANTAWFVSADAGYEVTAAGNELNLSLIGYTVTYNLDGGSLAQDESNPGIYYVNTDTFTLHNPTRVGYLFTGWTGTELDAATMEVTITKGSTGNRGYTATWQECTHPNVTYDGNVNGTHTVTCGVCHAEFLEDCSGGKATCAKGAVCGKCGDEYTDKNSANHDSTVAFDADGFCPNGCYEEPVLVTAENWEALGLSEAYIGYRAISKAGHLYWLGHEVAHVSMNVNAVLLGDIQVNAGTMNAETTGARPWILIGNVGRGYLGVFDGRDHTISGLYFNDPDTTQSIGLFGAIYQGGVVKNVKVTNSYFNGNQDAGGITGRNYSDVINCSFSGIVNAKGNAGGIAGSIPQTDSAKKGSISFCHNSGSVIGNAAGGIVGSSYEGSVTQCYNIGNITSTGNGAAGGVVGNNNGTVNSSYNTGNVSGMGSGSIGGIAGNCNFATVSSSYNTGSVGNGTFVGSIVGAYYEYTISNCYYLDTEETDQIDGTTYKTAEQFASGEVAYLLNGSTSEGELVWKQTVGTDASPKFAGQAVYQVATCKEGVWAYSNVNEALGHSTGKEGDKAATCAEAAYCSFCESHYGDPLNHSGNTNTQYTDNGNGTHSLICSVCGEAAETGDHTCGEATDNGNGTHSADCSACGTTVTNDHDYGTTHRCECGKGEAFAVSLANDIYYVTVDYSQTATFGTDYTATITPDQYFYIGDDHWVTIGGDDYTGYTLAEGVLTIPGADITGEIVIYARGYLIPAKVTWDYNGGTVVVEHEGEVWIKTQSGANTYLGRTTDTAFCVELDKLTRSGYLLTGWNTVKEPTEENPGVAYAKDADIFVDKENIVLYAQWTKIDLSAENGTYNGQAHKPTVTIEGMTEGTDFQVTYPADMTSVGEKTITVTDLHEYGSTTTVTYAVEARDISDAVVTMDDDLTYNGKTQSAKITKVQLGDMILTEGTDYTLSGNTAANSGEHELTVTGTGNFTGSVKAEWKIAKRLAAITAKDQTITYGGDISGTEYTADGLVDGHSVSVTLTPNTDKVTVNGSIAVSGAKITAGDVDVTANYDITYASGKLVIEPDVSAIKDLTAENVTSADEEAVKAVQDMLDNAESTKEEWADISEKCEQLLDRIDEVKKQNEAIAEDVASFDEESVNSNDKAALEELAEEMEALLESENLTQEEREALGVDLEQVEDMIAAIEQIAADSKAATDQVEALDSETVTSDDQTQLEQAVANIEELLETDHLTEEERKALAEVKASAETMLETVEAAHKAVDTESINNSMEITAENVSREDKEILAKAKSDLEKALHNHGGNYTEEEKQIIRTELVRIQKALKVIENAEDVEAAIDALPETVVPDDGEMAIKILNVKAEYDALTEHEKSLVTEAAVKKLNGLLAALTDYRLIMGGGGIFTKESKEGLYFKANGHFDKFTGILVDGKAVDKSNYEAKSGSTIVILKPAYLDTLAEGEHTLTFLYTDGEVSGTFLVKAKAIVPPTTEDEETVPPTTEEEPSTTPPTGDGFQPMLWIAVMSISLGLMVLLEERRRNIRK